MKSCIRNRGLGPGPGPAVASATVCSWQLHHPAYMLALHQQANDSGWMRPFGTVHVATSCSDACTEQHSVTLPWQCQCDMTSRTGIGLANLSKIRRGPRSEAGTVIENC
jgi:hypothetical protein